MKRLNLYEQNPQTVNGTIQNIQQVLDTTREGTVIRTVDGETEALISPDGNIYVNGEPIGSGGGTAISGMTDNAIVRGDGTTDIQSSVLSITDAGNITSTGNSLGVTLADASTMLLNSTGLTVNGTLLVNDGGPAPTAETYMVLDRAELIGKTVDASIDRIYCRYYDSNWKDCRNPEASAPHISGHWLRRHTISGSGTEAQRLANGWGDAQDGQYWRQTDSNPNRIWWWLSNTTYCDDPVWLEVGYVGYAWHTSNGGNYYWCVDEVEPNALQMGALNGNLQQTNDNLALQSLADFYNAGRNVFMPAGYYTTTTPIQLKTRGANTFRGEGGVGSTMVTEIITNGAINAIEISEAVSGRGFLGRLKDFTVWGGLDGIHANAMAGDQGIHYTIWEGVAAYAPRHGFYIPSSYSFEMRNCLGISYSDGCGFAMRGGVGSLFTQCQGGGAGTLTAAFRVRHDATFVGCNTVCDLGWSARAAYGMLLGGYASIASANTGVASSTITLNAASSAAFVTDSIIGRDIVITSGNGSGQRRKITAYNSSTKVADVYPAWSTLPSVGASYTIEDPVDFMRLTENVLATSSFATINCNFETYGKTGLRTVGDTSLTVIGCSFYAGPGSAHSAIRLSKDIDSSQVTIINPTFYEYGSATDPIVTEGTPYVINNPGPNHCYDVVNNKVHKWGDGTSSAYADLPTGVATGTRAFVNACNENRFGYQITGAGSYYVPAVWSGSMWIVG